MFGAKQLNCGDLTLLDPDWAAGVGVRVVLFERSNRLHQLAAAKLQVRRVELLKDDIRDNLRILVEKSYCEADLARRVQTVEVRFGQTVVQGDLLFTLSSSEVDAKLTQAEAAQDAASAMQPKSNAGARRQEVRAACIV